MCHEYFLLASSLDFMTPDHHRTMNGEISINLIFNLHNSTGMEGREYKTRHTQKKMYKNQF